MEENVKSVNVKENAIPAKKLEMRYNKVVVRLRERIELDLPIVLTNANKIEELHELRKTCKKPIVLTNANKIEELHELRKTCKKLRYLLELASHQNGINNKEINAVITELEDVQDILGSIHDSDTTIAYLKSRPNKPHILHDEISERNKKYEDFIQFCKRSLSDARHNLLNQIVLLT
jgi:CHAD domain-containing protein